MAFTYGTYKKSDEVKKAEQAAKDAATYTQSDAVTKAYDNYQQTAANKPAEWTGGQYGTLKENAYNAYTNRDKFSYDLNGDALYQQYKNQYMTQGKLAMQDTIGQASAMTGGYGNSYAATAGNQAYQSYLQNLNDVVPQLYQLALDKYNQEGNDLLNQYNLASDLYNTEYGEHRDSVADWENELSRNYGIYSDERTYDWTQFNDNRTYLTDAADKLLNNEYGMWSDSEDRRASAYSIGLQEKQADQSAQIAALQGQLSQKGISDFKAGLLSEEEFKDKATEKQLAGTVAGTLPAYPGRTGLLGTPQLTTAKTVYDYKGKTYNSYNEYVVNQIESAYEAGNLTAAQVKALLEIYDE